jgi:hypothetical protein
VLIFEAFEKRTPEGPKFFRQPHKTLECGNLLPLLKSADKAAHSKKKRLGNSLQN